MHNVYVYIVYYNVFKTPMKKMILFFLYLRVNGQFPQNMHHINFIAFIHIYYKGMYNIMLVANFIVIFKVVIMARLIFGLYNYMVLLINFLGLKSQNK